MQAYLREYAGSHVHGMTDSELHENARKWLKEAQELHVTDEIAFRKYCYLQAVHGGRLTDSPVFCQHSPQMNASLSGNDRVHGMMRFMIERLETV